MGISDVTFYRWKKLYGGLDSQEIRRLKQLEDALKVLLCNPGSIVRDCEFPVLFLFGTGNGDDALGLVHVFNGVTE